MDPIDMTLIGIKAGKRVEGTTDEHPVCLTFKTADGQIEILAPMNHPLGQINSGDTFTLMSRTHEGRSGFAAPRLSAQDERESVTQEPLEQPTQLPHTSDAPEIPPAE